VQFAGLLLLFNLVPLAGDISWAAFIAEVVVRLVDDARLRLFLGSLVACLCKEGGSPSFLQKNKIKNAKGFSRSCGSLPCARAYVCILWTCKLGWRFAAGIEVSTYSIHLRYVDRTTAELY
jgi:hypothetical protein